MGQKREFCVSTPQGMLRVYAKTPTDSADSYPGVYVDLIPKGRGADDAMMLTCVEYVEPEDYIQTCVYQPEVEDPVQIVRHEKPKIAYVCTIEETLSRTVVIRAESEDDAATALRNLREEERIVLTADDFCDVQFTTKAASPMDDLSQHEVFSAEDLL